MTTQAQCKRLQQGNISLTYVCPSFRNSRWYFQFLVVFSQSFCLLPVKECALKVHNLFLYDQFKTLHTYTGTNESFCIFSSTFLQERMLFLNFDRNYKVKCYPQYRGKIKYFPNSQRVTTKKLGQAGNYSYIIFARAVIKCQEFAGG